MALSFGFRHLPVDFARFPFFANTEDRRIVVLCLSKLELLGWDVLTFVILPLVYRQHGYCQHDRGQQ